MNSSPFNRLCLFTIFALSVPAGENLVAQKVGDRVVATASVYTKILRERVDKVFGGEIDTITEIDGKWCALSRSKGWLPLQYVMNLDAGEKYYTARIEKNEKDFDAWAIRGMIRLEKDQLASALADINKSISLNQSNPVTFNNRGFILKEMGRLTEAMVNFDQAIKLNPDYADAHENKGLVSVSLGKPKEAIGSYDKAILLRKDNPLSYINRGTAKSNSGDYAGAKADFLQALGMDGDISDTYVGLSVVYLAENDLDKAHRFASEAIKKNPRDGLAFNQRGWSNYKLDKLDEAIFDFDQAIRYAPTLSIAFNNRGVVHTDKGNHEQAIKDLNRAISLNPNVAVSYTNRAAAYLVAREYEKGLKDLKKANELSPNLPDAANLLGWFLATCPDEKFRDGEEARKQALRACELTQWKEWSFIDTLAAAEAELGNFEQAVEQETKALELAPEEAKSKCEERLQLYKDGKPCRDEFGKSAND